MIVWWCCIPLLVLGLWFTIKHRARQVAPILIYTFFLTLTYSILQGNVGTAYRQRAQLLIFYFVFVSIGFVLGREKREEKVRQRKAEQEVSRTRAARLPESKDQLPSREKAILTN